jgi:2-methylisocitrate lyase-like PEP mutase family enzyme
LVIVKMTKTLVEQLESGDFITAPGVFDMISTLIATRMNFPALYVTGYGISASYMGLPDAGLMTFTDMETQIRKIVAATDKPVIADADTGYGGLLNVRHTVKAYENLGVSAIQIEDQEYPKKCGHTPGRRVIPTSDMVTKIKVAVDTRTKDDFLIIARTDSRTGLGIEEAISRAVAFEEAGADIIFVEAPETESEMKMVNAAIKKPTLANMVSGGKTPIFSSSALQDMGYSVAIHPALGFLAMGEALKTAYTKLDTTGNVTGVALEDFGEFSRIMGFEDVWDFEKKWADG